MGLEEEEGFVLLFDPQNISPGIVLVFSLLADNTSLWR